MKLNAKQLRSSKPDAGQLTELRRNPVFIVLDNVLDTYNIGSIFRLADAVAAAEVILCGHTERPPSSRIHKSAIGTEEWVPWRYVEKVTEEMKRLRDRGVKIVAVEQDLRAVSLFDLKIEVSDEEPVAIVVGHETRGVSKEVLDMADIIVEIPMWGINKSLNVMVSTGIVLYRLLAD